MVYVQPVIMPTHIIALGGSLLRPEEAEMRGVWFGQLRQMAVHFEGNGRKLGIVVGGGLAAREAIKLAKETVTESYRLDSIGIMATRLNASILQQSLIEIGCNVNPKIPETTASASEMFESYDIVIMGGTIPGHTTDAVAVELARDCGSPHCVIATNVSHVYDSDPRKNPAAKKFDEITLSKLAQITGKDAQGPGESAVVDPIAVKRAIEFGIRLAVLDGRNLSILEDALEGRPFVGTLVKVD